MKKITFLFVLIFSLTSYASIKILSGYSIILPKNKEENLDKLIEFYGDVENTSDENSYLKEIKVIRILLLQFYLTRTIQMIMFQSI